MSYLLSILLGIVFLPITLIFSWVIIHPQEEAVVMFFGKFTRLLRTPGLYWCNIWGRKVIKISTKKQAIDIPRSVVADGNGNPIVVAGVVTYRFVDSEKAALHVEDASDYVRTQALAVLKQLCSRYPYESKEGESLKSEAAEIGQEMVKLLQEKAAAAGADVAAFELSDLTYAPEIASAMLVRQQAQALVDARKTIVEGAVEIVSDAVTMLEERGLGIPKDEQPRMISNLLTVICGDSNVQPTMPVGAAPGEKSDKRSEKVEELLAKIAKNTTPSG